MNIREIFSCSKSLKIWEWDFPQLGRPITATWFYLTPHSTSTLWQTRANCLGTSTWRVNSPKITNLWTLLLQFTQLRTALNMGQNLWQDYIHLCLTCFLCMIEMNLSTPFSFEVFICHLFPLYQCSSLHSVAADILVLCVYLFLFSTDIIFYCNYRKCINQLISVNRGTEGNRRNSRDWSNFVSLLQCSIEHMYTQVAVYNTEPQRPRTAVWII